MKARRQLVASFDELMEQRYGRAPKRLLREPASLEGLLAGYYGALPSKRARKKVTPAVSLSLGCDDGTMILAQRSRPANGNGADLTGSGGDSAHPLANGGSGTPALAAPPLPPDASFPAPTPVAAPMPAPAPQAEILPPPGSGTSADIASGDVRPQFADANGSSGSRERIVGIPSEANFLADMKSIVSGQSVYDPVQQKTVRKNDLKEYPHESEGTRESSDGRSPPTSDNQSAIFDRIAKSMQYAGAYDLGSVELENRFSDFDRMDDLSRRKPNGKRRPTPPEAAAKTPAAIPEPPVVDNADFIQDLDAIQRQAAAVEVGATMAPPPVAGLAPMAPLAQEASIPPGYSAPFYDTGEHVLPGEDLYRDQLRVGRSPGVLFSYGQIIAMADLFEEVNHMMAEDPAALQNLKRLIEQSAAYYRGGRLPSLRNVSDDTWEVATGGRYLRLAENNYDHFAPNFLFAGQPFAASINQRRNHKTRWEDHHERAIREAQRMALDPANANRSYVPVWPLIINAFGDHFLTDAFAAGHVINKEVVMEYFKTQFYSGRSLTEAANTFFDRVAAKAWQMGDVAARFSRLETVDRIWLHHPNINSADRFATVLKRVGEQEPDKVANLAVKAVHDWLNKDGIDVVNGLVSRPWKLTGDGHQTPTTLAIMKQAVAQSVANINDPSIRASNIAFGNYFAKVWNYVPRLTPASEVAVKALVMDQVKPTSTRLVDTAAEVIASAVNALIKALKEKGALRDA